MTGTRWRVALRAVIGVLVSVAACIVLVNVADVGSAIDHVLAADVRWVVAGVLLVTVQLVVRSGRWAVLLTGITGERVTYRHTVGPLAAGYLGNTVLPARLGEAVRAVLITRSTPIPLTAAAASVIVERLIDLLALAAVAATAFALLGRVTWAAPFGAVVLLLALSLVVRALPRIAARVPHRLPDRVRGVITNALDGLGRIPGRVMVMAWGMSLVAWLLDAAIMWCCAQALGSPEPIGVVVVLSVGAALGAALPAAAGYVGTYELGAVALASLVGMTPDEALRIAVLAHAVTLLPLAFYGLLALVRLAAAPRSSAPDRHGSRKDEAVAKL